MKTMTVRQLILAALFAALTAVCSQIAIPVGPIPINLALFAVYLAGGILGWKYGLLSQLCFILMGAVGLPVFAGFKGGFQVLAGPTGGYLLGYLFAALLVGLLVEKLGAKYWVCVVSALCGLTACYLFGTAWYIVSTGSALGPALMACVVPFLPGDAVKLLLATLLIPRLRKVLHKHTV